MPGMITSRHGRMRLTEPRPFSRDGGSASESRPREGAHALIRRPNRNWYLYATMMRGESQWLAQPPGGVRK